jgi:hypothetical protein
MPELPEVASTAIRLNNEIQQTEEQHIGYLKYRYEKKR